MLPPMLIAGMSHIDFARNVIKLAYAGAWQASRAQKAMPKSRARLSRSSPARGENRLAAPSFAGNARARLLLGVWEIVMHVTTIFS